MSPNPITLAIVFVLVGFGALLILTGPIVPGAFLIGLGVIVFASLKWHNNGSKRWCCAPASSSQ